MPSHTISQNTKTKPEGPQVAVSHELTGPGADVVLLRLNVRQQKHLPQSVPNGNWSPPQTKTGFERKRDVVEPIVKERNGISAENLLDDLVTAGYILGDVNTKPVMQGDVVKGHNLTLRFQRPHVELEQVGVTPDDAMIKDIKSSLLCYAFRDGWVYPNPDTMITINLVARRTDFDVESAPALRVNDNHLVLMV